MATDLVGNVKLQRFIELLAELNHLSADAVRSGKLELLPKMNSVYSMSDLKNLLQKLLTRD
jgi:hypothetical protein